MNIAILLAVVAYVIAPASNTLFLLHLIDALFSLFFAQ